MNRRNAVAAALAAALLAACQRAPEPQATAQPSPSTPPVAEASLAPGLAPEAGAAQGLDSGAAPGLAPAPEMEPAEPMAAPAVREAPRAATRPRTSRAPQAAPRTPSRSDRVERVDRVPAAEPIDIGEEDPRVAAAQRDREGREAPAAAEVRPERIVIPAGTELQLVLEEGLSSKTSQVGDPVTARVARATGPDGRVLLPGGSVIKGRVYRADAAGRVKGRSRLAVDFDRIVVRGVEHRLDTTAIDVQGPDSHGRDAAIVGGSTVGGAIVGGILGGGKGAKKGAVIGAVGGAGAVLATRGRDVEIPSGSRWTVRVKDRVSLN